MSCYYILINYWEKIGHFCRLHLRYREKNCNHHLEIGNRRARIRSGGWRTRRVVRHVGRICQISFKCTHLCSSAPQKHSITRRSSRSSRRMVEFRASCVYMYTINGSLKHRPDPCTTLFCPSAASVFLRLSLSLSLSPSLMLLCFGRNGGENTQREDGPLIFSSFLFCGFFVVANGCRRSVRLTESRRR